MIRQWFRQRKAARQAEYARRLERLLKMYPHDSPLVVEGLLSTPIVASCAAKALLWAAEQREEEDRLRRILREELGSLS